jgi:4-aminobutyrate aminotransferase-like enzyme/Ser/Thr protein kinase RdoA (MazF antagonist)
MSLLQQAPRFDTTAASGIARRSYGLEVTATALPSERDQNFLLETATGERYVLKIANATEQRDLLESQNAAMAHLAARTDLCPRLIPAQSGEPIVQAGSHFARLVTWLPGVTLGETKRHSRGLLEDLGARLGELDAALETFDHPAAHRDFYWDLARGPRTVRERLALVADPILRRFIEDVLRRIEGGQAAEFEALPRSIVHNDANDYNVLVSGLRVSGLIDFGDMVHTVTIADPAVAMAYAILDRPDPLAIMGAVARGYHAHRPFTAGELQVLFDLVCLRLIMSVCIAADQQRQRPGDEYLAISQAPIRRTLPRLAAIPSRLAEVSLRAACGMDPHPPASRLAAWLRGDDVRPAPILGTPLDRSRAVVIDLGIGSPLVSADPSENTEPRLTARIDEARRAAHQGVGVGRYAEARLLYSSPLFAPPDGSGERRTVHLGIDLFVSPGTPVRAPLAARVHAIADNAAPLDYGPVVILEHRTSDGEPFYTLYGHLGRDAVARLRPGQQIDAGEPFAEIGTPDVNGGWTPHVHFQLMTDLLGLGTEFPGVCRASERDAWCALSLDPNLVLGIPDDLFPAELSNDGTLAARRRVTGRNLSLAYADPVKIVRGWKQYLYDDNGRRYLDAYNNVPHVGHAHPRVAEAVERQMRVLNTNTRYLHDNLVSLAERLTGMLPAPLRVCYFVNSGSEANELALRMARAHTKQRDVIVLDAAYHGHTTTLIDISPYKFNGPGGTGKPEWVHVVPIPDVYRGRDTDASRARDRYAKTVAETLERMRSDGRSPAAFIAETCPSVGGQIVFPPGYLDAVYRHVRAAGGVCIADEVQTAYGRMGTSFYAFEDQRVVPDIVVLGKPIGNGYPIGAVITTEEIAASFANGMEFFSTFGGSTVSCAAALAVLDIVHDEELQSQALRVGAHLVGRLRAIAERHQIVGDVRGSGLFLGVELVKDRATLEPARSEAEYVVNRLREEGILLGTDGPFHNVLKIRPPMPFDVSDADALAFALDGVLSEVSE